MIKLTNVNYKVKHFNYYELIPRNYLFYYLNEELKTLFVVNKKAWSWDISDTIYYRIKEND